MGIRNSSLDWLKSYLQDRCQYTHANYRCQYTHANYRCQYTHANYRCQYTHANGTNSSLLPQGIHFGPIIIPPYDITTVTQNCSIRLYADDNAIYAHADNVKDAYNWVQNDITTLVAWCKSNQLSINISQTKSVLFGSRKFTNVKWLPKLSL